MSFGFSNVEEINIDFLGEAKGYIYRYTSLNQEVKRPRTSKHTGYIRKTVRKIISYKPELCSSTTLPTLE
jgi:hypothetical protein